MAHTCVNPSPHPLSRKLPLAHVEAVRRPREVLLRGDNTVYLVLRRDLVPAFGAKAAGADDETRDFDPVGHGGLIALSGQTSIMLSWRIEAHLDAMTDEVVAIYGGWVNFESATGRDRGFPRKNYS